MSMLPLLVFYENCTIGCSLWDTSIPMFRNAVSSWQRKKRFPSAAEFYTRNLLANYPLESS